MTDSYSPTEAMRKEAERGLSWRKEFDRGGTQVGVARARDISGGKSLSLDTVRRMHSFFARHEVDKKAEGFSPGEDGYPSAGRIAWALWGGDAGQSWARKIAGTKAKDGEMKFTDAATIAGARKTSDGYLVAEAFAVRTGVQVYSGAEMGVVDRELVRVYRPEDEVRSPVSLATFSHAPVTLGHPDRVTADNWKDLAKGEVSTEAQWDGNKIKLPLIVKDADAIAAIEAGTRELSAGYTCDIEWKSGEAADGGEYDAIQRNIRINHLAIVPRGRAGSECRIGDDADAWGAAPITPSKTKETHMSDALNTVVLGDKAIRVAPADEAVINQWKADQAKALADMKAEYEEKAEAAEKEMAKKDAALEDAKAKVLSDADLDKRVADRADLIGKAKSIYKDAETAGMSDAAIRKAVVAAKLGDAAVADKTDAYIQGRFDALADKAAKGDVFADTVRSIAAPATIADTADKAYADHINNLSSAWMGDQGKGA